jgi:gamma-glutamylcyclotransferase (GGCT)/AIG2-like uncharacterized protein YtfP
MLDRLFVYGTLKRGYDHPMARLLAAEADDLGPATMPGRLVLVRHYPGLIAPGDPADIVHGELFRLRRPRELLKTLDDYEGCGEGCAEPAEFRRETALVTPTGGAAVEAFVYRYNREAGSLPRIASGRFQPEQFSG